MKRIFGLLIAVVLSGMVNAQSFELGVTGGGSYYFGDLNDQHFKFIRPAAGIFFRKNFHRYTAFKGQFLYASYYADDSKSNVPFNQARGLSFDDNPVLETSAVFEFNFLGFEAHSKSKDRFSPYIFGGFSFFLTSNENRGQGKYDINPNQVSPGDLTVDLEELKRKDKKNYFLGMPIGLGFKAYMGGRVTLAVHAAARKTFTDNLDGITSVYYNSDPNFNPNNRPVLSQSANSQDNDWWFYFGGSLSIALSKDHDICPGQNF